MHIQTMADQLIHNAEALRLFFTEDVYLADRNEQEEMAGHDAPTRPLEFTFLGKNEKRILILVNDQENEVSTEEGRGLLRNLVKAINLTANDFALVNYANYPSARIDDFDQYFDCELILAFGVNAAALNLPAQSLHELHSRGQTRLLFTHNLNVLVTDTAAKKILWASLQKLIIK